MFEKCCCFRRHRNRLREGRSATLCCEHGAGVVWRHGASTLKTAALWAAAHPREMFGGHGRVAPRCAPRNRSLSPVNRGMNELTTNRRSFDKDAGEGAFALQQ